MGILEYVDWLTDGALPVQAAMCDPEATELSAASFRQSWGWPWAPIVETLQLWGVLVLALTAAGLAQQAFASAVSEISSAISVHNSLSADTAAMGAVAAHYAKKSPQGLNPRTVTTGVSKVSLENLAQLFLQSSFYALIFEKLTEAGRAKLLFSMALGLLAASKKLLELAIGICSESCPEIVKIKEEVTNKLLIPSFFHFFPGYRHCNGLLGERQALFRALLPDSSVESHHGLRGSLELRMQIHHVRVSTACQG